MLSTIYPFLPGTHYQWIARLLAIVVLGGLGSLPGAVLGALVIVFREVIEAGLIVGIVMGIGKAAVYKFIPEYYPLQVGVVGGIVGVLGGLGGFIGPILFGYMLQGTGIWTTAWMFFLIITALSFAWMLFTVRRMMRLQAPSLAHHIEDRHDALPEPTA